MATEIMFIILLRAIWIFSSTINHFLGQVWVLGPWGRANNQTRLWSCFRVHLSRHELIMFCKMLLKFSRTMQNLKLLDLHGRNLIIGLHWKKTFRFLTMIPDQMRLVILYLNRPKNRLVVILKCFLEVSLYWDQKFWS